MKSRYYRAAIGLYVVGVIGLGVLGAVEMGLLWIPFIVVGCSCWVAAAVLAIRGRLFVRRRAREPWREGLLMLSVSGLPAIGFVLLLLGSFLHPASDFGR